MFRKQYADVFDGQRRVERDRRSPRASCTRGTTTSTYIQEPPFFVDLTPKPRPIQPTSSGARVLAVLGDSVTTDHISPAGSITADSPAGQVPASSTACTPTDFNSYGARRGNDRVMTRGTFANIRLRNLLAPGTEGGVTRHLPDGDADVDLRRGDEVQGRGRAAGRPGRQGIRHRSARDWAAKGTFLLGVRAVIAASFERIHRSNLVGMGVLPLQFLTGETLASRSA